MILHDLDESALPLNCSLFILLPKRPPLLWPETFQFKRKSMCHTWRTCRPYREGLPDPNSIWDQKNKYDQNTKEICQREPGKPTRHAKIHIHTRIVQIHAQIHATVEKERDRQTSRPGGQADKGPGGAPRGPRRTTNIVELQNFLIFHWS